MKKNRPIRKTSRRRPVSAPSVSQQRPVPVPSLAITINGGSGGGGCSQVVPSPRPLKRFWASRWVRFFVFLSIVAGLTILLTLSSHALFTVLLALGVASVVSASWKFSA